MLKLSLPLCFLLGLFLCIGTANVPAQELEMKPPPIPDVLPSPPPDPDTLTPPQLVWAPLELKASSGPSSPPPAVAVAPPLSESSIPEPPPPFVETPLPGGANLAQMELAKPDVEIWRGESEWPQIPPRRFNKLELAYVTGTEPVWLRVQFNPLAAGKNVSVRPGRGITLQAPDAVLTISSSGECIVLAQLDESVSQSHIIFYCEGIKTVLPLSRMSLAKVEEKEAESGGGQ